MRERAIFDLTKEAMLSNDATLQAGALEAVDAFLIDHPKSLLAMSLKKFLLSALGRVEELDAVKSRYNQATMEFWERRTNKETAESICALLRAFEEDDRVELSRMLIQLDNRLAIDPTNLAALHYKAGILRRFERDQEAEEVERLYEHEMALQFPELSSE